MSPRHTKGSRKKPARSRGGGRSRSTGRRRSLTSTLGLFAAVTMLAAIGVGVVQEEASPPVQIEQDVVWNGARVRVDVQNGGGVSGMARAAMEILRPSGFDVVSFGNAPSFDPDRPSAVIDRVGRTDQAQAVAKALGIDNVLSEPNPNLYVDVTVVLGRAWDPELDDRDIPAPGTLSWWDPRGWFGS